jgi:hypothetical protein
MNASTISCISENTSKLKEYETPFYMQENCYLEIDNLFNSNEDQGLIQTRLNIILSQLCTSDQLGLYSELSDKALAGIYIMIDKINISKGAAEHIIWYYYKKKIEASSNTVNDKVVIQILNDYGKYKYIALESLIIELIKNYRLTPELFISTQETLTDNTEIRKQIYLSKIRSQIRGGEVLNKEQIVKLLNYAAYYDLNSILDQKAVNADSLDLFAKPEINESHKKIKTILYEKARMLLDDL